MKLTASGLATFLALSVATVAHGNVIYSNFGLGDTFDASFGNQISGGQNVMSAGRFVITADTTLRSIEVGLSHNPNAQPGDTFDAEIVLFSASGGLPDQIIESLGVVNVAAGAPAIYEVLSISNPTLTAGMSYFVGVLPGSQSTEVAWNNNLTGDDERYWKFGGGAWMPSSTVGAYRVNAVPAPGVLALVGAGGLLATRRRR